MQILDAVLSVAILALESVGAAMIVGSAGAAVFLMVNDLMRRWRVSWEESRRMLGRGLVLGLDFLIGADILRTMVTPQLGEIGVLAAIIILRTILSLTIEFELRRTPGGPDDGGP